MQEYIASVSVLLKKHGYKYVLIGGQAAIVYGEPRFTKDADFILFTNSDNFASIVEILKSGGFDPRPKNLQNFVHQTSILPLVHTESGFQVDISFASTVFEEEVLEQAVEIMFAGQKVKTARAEHLIIFKLVAGRPLDVTDIENIVIRQGTKLDYKLIERWLEQFKLVPGLEDICARWQQCLANTK